MVESEKHKWFVAKRRASCRAVPAEAATEDSTTRSAYSPRFLPVRSVPSLLQHERLICQGESSGVPAAGREALKGPTW